jgi:hypothetical protein
MKIRRLATVVTGLALVMSFGLMGAGGGAVAASPRVTHETSPSPIDGNWDGTYTCGSHPDGLHLQIKGGNSNLTAVFVFYPLPTDPGGFGPGEFSMTGTYASASSITLNPNAWIIDPGGEMVGLSGSLSGDVFSGSVPGCSTFSVTKTTKPPSRSALLGVWDGSYLGCVQGPTRLKLTVSKDGSTGNKMSAVFKFSALASNPGVPTGSYNVAGFVFPKWVVFIGTTWIHHPGSYQIVSLIGAHPSSKSFTGIVSTCKTFSLKLK